MGSSKGGRGTAAGQVQVTQEEDQTLGTGKGLLWKPVGVKMARGKPDGGLRGVGRAQSLDMALEGGLARVFVDVEAQPVEF